MTEGTRITHGEGGSAPQRRVMNQLADDHVHITAVLDALESIVKLGEQDDINWEMMADIVSYLQEYPDTVHHPVEDRLFDRVLDKGLTPAERELVHGNLAQHAEIIGATTQLGRDVTNILGDIVVPVDRLTEHLQHYLGLQRSHLRSETYHLFPLAERLLNEADWRDIADEMDEYADPMFEMNAEKFASLYRFITQTSQE